MATKHRTRKTANNQPRSIQAPSPIVKPRLEPEIIAARGRPTSTGLPVGVIRTEFRDGFRLTGKRAAMLASRLVKAEWLAPEGAKDHYRFVTLPDGIEVCTNRTYGGKVTVSFHGISSGRSGQRKLAEALEAEKKEVGGLCGSHDQYRYRADLLVSQLERMVKPLIESHDGGYQTNWWDAKGIRKAMDNLAREVRFARIEYYEVARKREIKALKLKTARADEALQDLLKRSVQAAQSGKVIGDAQA